MNNREICCSVSNSMTHAIDRQGGIWWWDADEQIWYRMDSVNEPLIRAESDFFVTQMRKALPMIRIFAESRFEGEREAAHSALCKLADAVNAMFRQSPHNGGARWKAMIKPGDLYSGLTREHRWQVLDVDLPEYDEAVAKAFRQRDPSWTWLGPDLGFRWVRPGDTGDDAPVFLMPETRNG